MRKEQVFAEADFFLIEPLRHLHKEKYKWPPIESPPPHSPMLISLTLSLLTGKRLGQRLKYAYMRSQGHESQTMSPREDDTWRRIMAPAFPLLKFAASLGFPGFAVEMRTESDSGIQAYYDIFGSKAMPSGLIKLDMAPSNPLVKDLYTESGRAQLEAYVLLLCLRYTRLSRVNSRIVSAHRSCART